LRWVALAAGVFGLLTGSVLGAKGREEEWQQVSDAVRKGQPRTAIERLGPIVRAATEEKAYAEAVRAVARKIVLENEIEGGRPEDRIAALREAIGGVPDPMRPVLRAILAKWYWNYFRENRARFAGRTPTAEPVGSDIATWDPARILTEIGRQFSEALTYDRVLKATPIGEYDDLLAPGTVPDRYRPSLYDFVVHRALAFHTSGDQADGHDDRDLVLQAGGPIFGPTETFMAWRVGTAELSDPVVKAVRLYQDLLSFHKEDRDRSAFAEADLGRIELGGAWAGGEDARERYQEALRRFIADWSEHEVSARAREVLASLLYDAGEHYAARAIALKGHEAFPESVGGRLCLGWVKRIESKEIRVFTEAVWNAPWPEMVVFYRNVTNIHFRAVPYPLEERLKTHDRMHLLDPVGDGKTVLARKPALAWSHALLPTPNYREGVARLAAPGKLKPGSYFLLASHDPAFGNADNVVAFAAICVSDLALIVRTRPGEGELEGLVLDAVGGGPVAGAPVRAWRRDAKTGKLDPISPVQTDEEGYFRFEALGHGASVFVHARYGEHEAFGLEEYGVSQYDRTAKPHEQTVFFTDRALYRPGQTVRYKGICIRADPAARDYGTVPCREAVVVFKDANGREVEREQHRANEFGSFSGSFTAPREGLTGLMTLDVEGEPRGHAGVAIEEYKRPKLDVMLDLPREPARVGDEVVVPGRVLAYSGAPVSRATVRYRVVRQPSLAPVRVRGPWRRESAVIARGTVFTRNDGSFVVKFVAKPDPAVPERDDSVFEYVVHADVTDEGGETRSGSRTVSAGYGVLEAFLEADPWQTATNPVAIRIRTETPDGRGLPAEGTVRIHRLKEPAKVIRASGDGECQGPVCADPFASGPSHAEPSLPGRQGDPSSVEGWDAGDLVARSAFRTDSNGVACWKARLDSGAFRAVIETRDRHGRPVTARLTFCVMDLEAKRFPIRVANTFVLSARSVQPGDTLVALWGTGYEKGRALVELEHGGRVLKRQWTEADRTQSVLSIPVTEEMRGGFTVRCTYVRENRVYLNVADVAVPWTNKRLDLKWERFVSKLVPGGKETWTAVVGGTHAARTDAEVVAGMYDASLDAYREHDWPAGFDCFPDDASSLDVSFANPMRSLDGFWGSWARGTVRIGPPYRRFPSELTGNDAESDPWPERGSSYPWDGQPWGFPGLCGGLMAGPAGAGPDPFGGGSGRVATKAALQGVKARRNLGETAFFFPHLEPDTNGTVRMEFTMPDALTEWRFLAFAHDNALRSGRIEERAVTARDLTVEPDGPRFVREGDEVEFTVKVGNRSAGPMRGTVRLTFADARTLDPMDRALKNRAVEREFDVPAMDSCTLSWRIRVPDGMGHLTYKAVGASGAHTDGEEGFVPVLSRRVWVREALPLSTRNAGTKKLEFPGLLKSKRSRTLRHQSLTLQIVSQPAWYAVTALPYLMETPGESTEQTFGRLYANALARHIAASDPRVRRTFDQWRDTPALDSPLTRNEEMKGLALRETPWVREAESESQARRNVGLLFDENRLRDETARLVGRMAELQLDDGSWPWFPGGPSSEHVTLRTVAGYGRLRHLGVRVDAAAAVKALDYLDGWAAEAHREAFKSGRPKENRLSPALALYLYTRSLYLAEKPVSEAHRDILDYWLGQARTYWTQLGNRQSQAHVALGLKRFGDRQTPGEIVASLKERAVSNDEMGMFWRDSESAWRWHDAPVETQAMMIEAMEEVAGDSAAVEAAKVWLLKQKQSRDWRTTPATADAVYALLLRGTNLLNSVARVGIALGSRPALNLAAEAGSGFAEKRFPAGEVAWDMGRIALTNPDGGVAWGGVYWHYLDDADEVRTREGTPLKVSRGLFRAETTRKGKSLVPVKGDLGVGDEVVARIELRSDRDLDYVHLRDQHGSGMEPVNVLSGYRHRDGLSYYESTCDTASDFFIERLPKGAYVFEYPLRVRHRGAFAAGMAEVRCLYAPEFSSRSENATVVVK
jgi:hypothetical protein